jgi:Alr-MurF fusion protein
MELLLYATTDELLKHFPSIVFHLEDILLKGGRSFELEQIAALLEAQQHQTLLEINLTAMATNLRHYRSLISPGTKMMVMVKAFGYGSGDAEIGRALQFNGVDYLAVAFVDEGVALRQGGVHLPIMVLNTDPASFDHMEQYNLEPEVYSFEFLQTLLQWCRHKGISNYPVHLKIDTGMHRLGFETNSMGELGQQLAKQNALVVKSVFTHLVASEDPGEDAYTAQQLQWFDKACATLRLALGYSFLQHAANTAAISRHPQAHFDIVRLGVGLYGGSAGLLPVMQLATTVAQVKKVATGETVGYGRQARLHRDSIIATVRIGYADGYSRRLGNGVGAMYIKGRRAPVVGRICMDMTMLDVTDIPGVQAGDRVEVFGTHIGIQEVAHWCGTIPYEVMTGISQRVKRVYIEET